VRAVCDPGLRIMVRGIGRIVTCAAKLTASPIHPYRTETRNRSVKGAVPRISQIFGGPISHCQDVPYNPTLWLVESQVIAERAHHTMGEPFRETRRRHIAGDAYWDAHLERTRAKGEALGITNEAGVEHLLNTGATSADNLLRR